MCRFHLTAGIMSYTALHITPCVKGGTHPINWVTRLAIVRTQSARLLKGLPLSQGKYSITPSQEVGRIPPRQQRVGSDEAICSCNAGGGFCAVRHAQLSAHPFGCSRGKPWGHLSTCGESDTPAQALGGVGRFRFSHLWGGPGEGWQCHQDRPSQLGSALWRHLPGQERTEVRWALAAMVRTGL